MNTLPQPSVLLRPAIWFLVRAVCVPVGFCAANSAFAIFWLPGDRLSKLPVGIVVEDVVVVDCAHPGFARSKTIPTAVKRILIVMARLPLRFPPSAETCSTTGHNTRSVDPIPPPIMRSSRHLILGGEGAL